MSISQDDANEATARGAFVLCLDVPPGISFGIDYMTWTVGDRFRGVKMVPPGVHFIYTSPTGSRDDMSTRIGAFACLARGDVLVRRWSPEAEALLPLAEADDAERLARATRGFQFDAHLGAYPLDTWPRWAALMQCVTPAVIERLEPVQKFVFSSALSEAASKVTATPHSAQRDSQASATAVAASSADADSSSPAAAASTSAAAAATAVQNESSSSTQQQEPQKPLSVRLYAALGTGNMFFSDVATAPDAAMLRGLTPAQVTALHLDKSPLLLRVLGRLSPDAHGTAMSLMAELQVAFVAFMVGQSLVAFEQWKKIVVLLTSCGAALESHPTLFVAFARTLASQLDEVPTDFFEDELSAHSFLRRAIKDFFSNIGEAASVSRELMAEYKNLRAIIARRFNWHDLGLGLNDLKFDAGAGAFCLTNEEDDDEAPVFVSEAELASGSGL